ncbi:hypothetical protein ACWEQU_17250 [Streptomyces nodosus]
MYLEEALDHVAPAEQHRTLVLRQRRPPLGHELLDDCGAVGQPVLQREVIDRLDGGRLVQEAESVLGLVEPGGSAAGLMWISLGT